MKIQDNPHFLLHVRNGKCIRSRVGKNAITIGAKETARELGLENWEEFTSHSYRRSSATALVESGANTLALQRHGRWKSEQVAHRYLSESVNHQMSVAKRICYGDAVPSTSRASDRAVVVDSMTTTQTTQTTTRTAPAVAAAAVEVVPEASYFMGKNNIFNGPVNITVMKQ